MAVCVNQGVSEFEYVSIHMYNKYFISYRTISRHTLCLITIMIKNKILEKWWSVNCVQHSFLHHQFKGLDLFLCQWLCWFSMSHEKNWLYFFVIFTYDRISYRYTCLILFNSRWYILNHCNSFIYVLISFYFQGRGRNQGPYSREFTVRCTAPSNWMRMKWGRANTVYHWWHHFQ